MSAAEAALAAFRGLQLAASLWAFGTVLFGLVILPGGPDGDGGATQMARRAILAAVLAAFPWLVLQAFVLSSAESAASGIEALWPTLTHTRFGRVLALRLLLLALAGIALAWRAPVGRGSARGMLAALLTGASLALHALAGHAAAMEGADGTLLTLAVGFHLLAAGAWLGAMPALLAALATPQRAFLAARRFSPLGIACVLALAGSALFQTVELVGGLPGLVGTAYGALALAKIVLFAAMLALAARNRFRLTPALAVAPAAAAIAGLRRSVLVEAGLGLLVLGCAAWLASMTPGAHEQPWWPFPIRFSAEALGDPDLGPVALRALSAVLLGMALFCAGLVRRGWRLPGVIACIVLMAYGAPDLDLLTVQAFPTSFWSSPTGFAASSIAAAAPLFQANCEACHGPTGRGDGPAATGLPVAPADLTAGHLWDHRDGEIFWWLGNGMPGDEGRWVMPGFSGQLSEDQLWSLVDYVHALNAGAEAASALEWSHPVPAPEMVLSCPGRDAASLADLRGRVVLVAVADDGGSSPLAAVDPALLQQAGLEIASIGASTGAPCTADRGAAAAYRLVTGTPRGAAVMVLVDPEGFLREVWTPSCGGAEPMIARARQIAATPIARAAGSHHH